MNRRPGAAPGGIFSGGDDVSWIGWVVIGILAANVAFFGVLWVIYCVDKRRFDRNEQH